MPNESDAESNAARVAEVVALLGAERFCVLLEILDERLRHILIQLETGIYTHSLIDLVHQSRGSAGSLGLSQIAGSLGHLERVMRACLQDQSDRSRINSAQIGLMTNAVRKMSDELQAERLIVAQMT